MQPGRAENGLKKEKLTDMFVPEMDRAGEKERITLLSRNPIKTEKRTPQAKKRLWSFFYYDNISLVQKQLSL